jgi:hypothetical protein
MLFPQDLKVNLSEAKAVSREKATPPAALLNRVLQT